MNSQAIKIGIIIVALLAATVLFAKNFMSSGGSPDDGMDAVTHWVCKASGCENNFTLSVREMARSNSSQTEAGGPECPDCGKHTTFLAEICPSCQESYELGGHARMPDECPNCGEPLG